MDKETRKTIEKKLGLVVLNELKKENIKAADNVTKHIREAVRTITKKFAKALKAEQNPGKTRPKAIIAKPVTLSEMKNGPGSVATKVKRNVKSAAGASKKPVVKKKLAATTATKKSPAVVKAKPAKAVKKPAGSGSAQGNEVK